MKLKLLEYKKFNHLWVPVNSISKISNDWIKDLASISTYTKNRLVSWFDNKELSSETDDIG